MWETWIRSLGWEDPLEKEMAVHSSILAWRIPWTEEPGGLQSMGSLLVRHNWVSNTFTFLSRMSPYLEGKGTSIFCFEKSKYIWKFFFSFLFSSLHPTYTFDIKIKCNSVSRNSILKSQLPIIIYYMICCLLCSGINNIYMYSYGSTLEDNLKLLSYQLVFEVRDKISPSQSESKVTFNNYFSK